MLPSLRRTSRSRLQLLLLLLLSPGLGGWAVQVLHPCPAEAAHASAQGADDSTTHSTHAHGAHGTECHCFGSCTASHTFQAATAPTVAAPIPVFALTVPRPAEPGRPAAQQLTLLLPPATAPPVLS